MSSEQNEEQKNQQQPEEEQKKKKPMVVTSVEDLLNPEEEQTRSLDVANRYHGAEAHDFGPKDVFQVTNMSRMDVSHLQQYSAKLQAPDIKVPVKLDEPKMVYEIEEYSNSMPMDCGDDVDLLCETEFQKTTAVVSRMDKDTILKAIRNTHQVLQSERKQIRHQQFEEDGYGFDVNFTHKKRSPLTAKAEVIILEIPDTHPNQSFHGCRCILYTKLSGNGFAFQRYFRESINKLQKELQDLRPLCGKSLPTMDVFGKDDVDFETPSQLVDDSLTIVLQSLQSLGLIGFTCESLRELTDSLQNISSKHLDEALAWTAKTPSLHAAFKNLLENEEVGAFRDSTVIRNILRFYNSIVTEKFDFESKPVVCRALTEGGLFNLVLQRAEFWVNQQEEKVMTAEAVCDDIANFMNNVDRDYLSQGAQLPQVGNVKQILQRIVVAKNEGFVSFRKTCNDFLNKL